jgi:hypothetical protein
MGHITGTGRRTIPILVINLLALTGCAVPRTAPAPDPCIGDSPSAEVTITEANNGTQRCMTTGGTISVYLHGTADDRWSPVELSGTALTAAPSGKGTLPVGVTGGFFRAVGRGNALLASVRGPCAAPSSTASCDVEDRFEVTIVVR